ncbi:unnamed protein product, partial [Mesorhabditis belari]|uniref:Dimethyladenosine transferase 1, mitochondrial n=1 Tax=Mesorhabditis belari TaxID=2138241 RepID=A0AAF3J2F8_9BILA
MPLQPLVLSGPSGGGKSTILNRAMREYPDSFAFSVSHTTRRPREGEQHGVHYWFTERKTMEEMISNGEFLEHAEFGGNLYGTSRKQVEDTEKTGKICVLDIELQGVRNIKNSHLQAKYILIKAPSINILEERLRNRGTETEETLQKRLRHAEEDMRAVTNDPHLFDYIIVNEELESAYTQFINAIKEDLEATRKKHQMATSFSRLPPLPALRDFIHLYKLRAKKVLSQNFLMDMNLTNKIVRTAGINEGDWVCEVGPGPGGITRAILDRGVSRCDVIELDQRMLPALRHVGEAAGGRLHVHHGDVLKTEIGDIWTEAGCSHGSQWTDDPPRLHIVGNLPFNIASPLIIKFLRDMSYRRGPWKYGRVPLTLTFQAEVARRLVSPIDCDTRSRISIMAQYIARPKLLFTIPGTCFVPPPKIDVGVVRFEPRVTPLIGVSFEVIEKVARQVFHYRQKYAIKGLKTLYPEEIADEMAHEVLKETRIDPTTTSIKLGVEQYGDMAKVYERQCRSMPGLFAYDYTKPKVTVEMLANGEKALPPKCPFTVDIPSKGISLRDFEIIS